MVGQGAKQWCSLKSWCPIHVHTPMSMPSMLGGPNSQDGRWFIPKDLLYGELATGARCRGHPQLHYKDVCKCDMKAYSIDTESWEAFADDRTLCKQQVSQRLKRGEASIQEKKWWKMGQENSQSSAGPPRPTSSICLHMPGLQQRLQIQGWPLQPHKTMPISNLSGCYSIVDRLTDANNENKACSYATYYVVIIFVHCKIKIS